MKIENLGTVNHGVTLSRVEPKFLDEAVRFKLFTMQDLSKETGQYGLNIEESYAEVSKNKFDTNLLSKENLIIIGLTSYKAMVIRKKHINRVIPSNFATIELDLNKVYPSYFTWYFNEHPEVKKQLQIAMQGSIIKALSVQMLRDLEIKLPALKLQQTIGKTYELKRRKEKLLFGKNILENELYNQIIIDKLKEEIRICQ